MRWPAARRTLTRPDAPRADQYGLRGVVRAGGASIKFEIVLEGRITLATPTESDWLCGVPALTPPDMAASKLLANADRWADDSVFSRDLIDLAMMAPDRALLDAATAKAAAAYGDAVSRDLAAAIARLRERPGRLDACMRALKMDRVPKALLWSRIRRLRPRAAAGDERKPA